MPTVLKFQEKRLVTLIKFLAAMPVDNHKNWNMSDWLAHKDVPFEAKLRGKNGKLKRETPATCNTNACALGWATAIPAFQKAGLYAHVNEGKCHASLHYKDTHGGTESDSNLIVAQAFFGLTREEAFELFYDPHTQKVCRTPQIWAEVARAWLAKKKLAMKVTKH